MRGESLMKHCVFEQATPYVHMGGLRGECLAIFHSLSQPLKSYVRTWHSKQAEWRETAEGGEKNTLKDEGMKR